MRARGGGERMDHTAHGAERPLRAAGTAFGSMRRGRGLYGPVIMPFEYFEDICVQAHAQNTHARGTRRHTARERGEDIRRSPYVSSTTLKRGRGAISTSVHIGLAQDARPRIPHPHRPAIDATCIASAPHFLSSAKLTHKEAQREVPPGRDCGTPMRGIARTAMRQANGRPPAAAVAACGRAYSAVSNGTPPPQCILRPPTGIQVRKR
jgi:hypothetical protein